MKVINLNTFLDIEFKFCWACGKSKYNQFYLDGHLYRICAKCLKKPKIAEFVSNQNK